MNKNHYSDYVKYWAAYRSYCLRTDTQPVLDCPARKQSWDAVCTICDKLPAETARVINKIYDGVWEEVRGIAENVERCAGTSMSRSHVWKEIHRFEYAVAKERGLI